MAEARRWGKAGIRLTPQEIAASDIRGRQRADRAGEWVAGKHSHALAFARCILEGQP